MKDLFRYEPGNTVIHRLNPVTKVLLALVISIAAFIARNPYVLLGLLYLAASIGWIAGVPGKTLSILKGLLKASLLLFVLQLLLHRKGTPLFWIITDEGLLTAVMAALRLIVACLPLAQILAVTRVSDLANALVQVLHVPYKYAFTVTTAIRFIPQFLEEMSDIMEAQTARGVAFDKARGLRKLGMILPLCAPLLISSVRRTDQTAVAVEVRGFGLRTASSGYRRYPFGLIDAAALLLCAGMVAAAIMIR